MNILQKLNLLILVIGFIELCLVGSSVYSIFDINNVYINNKTVIDSIIIPHSITAIIGAITASGIAYFFQRTFRKEEKRKEIIRNIHSFNEAVIYSTAIFEELMSLANDESAISINEKEKKYILHIKNTDFPNNIFPKMSLITIPSIQVPNENLFLRKIPNVGKYADLGQAFYRLKRNLVELEKVTNDRTRLAIIESEKYNKKQDKEAAISNIAQINQRTETIIFYADCALNALAFIIKQLKTIKQEYTSAFSSLPIKDLKVCHYDISPKQLEIIINLERFVDNMPAFNPRFKH